MNHQEVFIGVRQCLSNVLDVPEESILPEQRILDDLGGDSLDLLDLSFQLEQKFKVSISPRDIERRTRAALGGKPIDVDGAYTPEALAELRKSMPEIPHNELADGLFVADLPRRLRVQSMVNLVCRLLEEKA
ncbi:MAG TPA: phosphopantetheine-binding protein [Planctomycetota bacterium]|nr:phosphopantetheine-binding protein [Planctomycetota bacterium]